MMRLSLIFRKSPLKTEYFIVRLNHLLKTILNAFISQLLHKCMNSMDPDPTEGRLLIMCMICLFNQTYGLKDICDIVKSANLRL